MRVTAAAELRRAPNIITFRAGYAAQGLANVQEPKDWEDLTDQFIGGFMGDHAGTWAPPMAAAVASWLTFTADHVESGNDIPALRGQGLDQALVLARLVNATARGAQ